MIAQAAVSLLNIGARPARCRRRAGAGRAPSAPPRRRARPRAGARRDRRRAGAAGDPRAHASPQRAERRCATRSRSCRWPTRARSRRAGGRRPRRPPEAPPPAGAAPGASEAAGSRRRSEQAPAGRRRRGRRPGPGGVQRAGCGCPAAEAWAPPRRSPRAAHPCRHRPPHDRLRPRLHRISARAERSGRQMCARRSSRGTPNQTAEDFC